MADIEIIRESGDGFTHQGHSVSYTDSYIKVRRSFRQHALRLLRGAPLSVFLEIALADEPPDVQTICANTGYTSTATVCAALDFLVERNFISEAGRVGSNGRKCYRAITYTWCGSDSNMPQDIVASASRISKNEIRHTPAKSEIPPPKTKIRRAKSEIRPTNNDNDLSKLKDKSKTLLNPDAQQIFRALGVNNPALSVLSAVETERAERWRQWIPLAPKNPYYAPVGYMVRVLTNDIQAEPPGLDDLLQAQQQERAAQEYERAIAAGEIETHQNDLRPPLLHSPVRGVAPVPIHDMGDPAAARHWANILLELQLQMTKATFDAWVKPTRAISFDDENARLCVGVRNAYAKQWLETRLRGIVERTAQNIIGKPVHVEFINGESV